MRVFTLDSDFGRTDPVRRIQFRPDGRLLAATVGERGRESAVVIWDVAEERERFREWTDTGGDLPRYADPALSPNLDWMAYHTHDEEADAESVVLTPVGRSEGEGSVGDPNRFRVRCLAFAPDGRTLRVGVVRDAGPMVARWDVERLSSGSLQAMTIAEEEPFDTYGPPHALACSPDGSRLYVGVAGGALALDWHGVGEPKRLHGMPREREPARELRIDPDGQFLAARFGQRVAVWEVAGGRLRGELSGPAKLGGFAWSPDGRTLALAGRDGTLALYDADTMTERARYDWSLGPLHGVAFAPDGLTGWVGLERGRLAAWDVDG